MKKKKLGIKIFSFISIVYGVILLYCCFGITWLNFSTPGMKDLLLTLFPTGKETLFYYFLMGSIFIISGVMLLKNTKLGKYLFFISLLFAFFDNIRIIHKTIILEGHMDYYVIFEAIIILILFVVSLIYFKHKVSTMS